MNRWVGFYRSRKPGWREGYGWVGDFSISPEFFLTSSDHKWRHIWLSDNRLLTKSAKSTDRRPVTSSRRSERSQTDLPFQSVLPSVDETSPVTRVRVTRREYEVESGSGLRTTRLSLKDSEERSNESFTIGVLSSFVQPYLTRSTERSQLIRPSVCLSVYSSRTLGVLELRGHLFRRRRDP